jgi:hypothetical protein
MYNRRHLYIIIGIGSLVIIGLLAWLFRAPSVNAPGTQEEVQGVVGEPIDIALDFMGAWIEARKSTSTNPYLEEVFLLPEVSLALGEKIQQSEAEFTETGFDPVLCQTEVPSGLRARPVLETDNEAQFLITPKEKESGVQVLVTLIQNKEHWVISDISCSTGEVPPEMGEYSFDQVGFLLKDNVPPPLNREYWHLVFSQNDVMGYTAPLFFSEASTCTFAAAEAACDLDTLGETMKVRVQGSMTEAGVEVARLNLVTE